MSRLVVLCALSLVLAAPAFGVPSFSGLGTPTIERVRPPGVPAEAIDWSPDGQFATGTSHTFGSPYEIWRWTPDTGFEVIGTSTIELARSVGISNDGRVIAISDSAHPAAARWVEGEEGWEIIPGAYQGNFGQAFGISGDGLLIVGNMDEFSPEKIEGEPPPRSRPEAMTWADSGEILRLGDLQGGDSESTAYGASYDGSFVVGYGTTVDGREAFIWDAAHGMRELDQVLVALGLDLSGWALTSATHISDDGRTIMGSGLNPDGESEAWIAVIPEPSTALLLGLGLLGLGVTSPSRGRSPTMTTWPQPS